MASKTYAQMLELAKLQYEELLNSPITEYETATDQMVRRNKLNELREEIEWLEGKVEQGSSDMGGQDLVVFKNRTQWS